MAPAVTRRLSNGETMTLEKSERERRIFSLLVEELPKRPEPVHAIRDYERGRSTSVEQFHRIEAAVIRASGPEAVFRYIGRRVQSALEHLVPPPHPLEHALQTEEDFEHVANRQQRLLTGYVLAKNTLGIRRMLTTAAQHQVALQQLQLSATHALQQIETPTSGLRA